MSEVRYMISDASKMLDVEPHVLRYWEEELQMDIPRNEMGHRYYRSRDIKVLENIKGLKNQGLQLKAIRMVITNDKFNESLDEHDSINIEDTIYQAKDDSDTGELEILTDGECKEDHIDKGELSTRKSSTVNTYSDKVVLFQQMLREMMEEVVNNKNAELNKLLSNSVSESVIKQMDYLLRMNEEKEAERFRKLDESIREVQKARKELGKKNRLLRIFG